jgi:hypothetical protein
MRLMSGVWSRQCPSWSARYFHGLLAMSVFAGLLAACGNGGGGADQAARGEESQQQATLPQTLCGLLPKADAERIMGKPLVEQRNDDFACHYQDAIGTAGTGLMVDLNILPVSDQCRLIPGSEPLSGVGDEACIAIGRPAGLYTTVVFRGGGRTFEVTAPGQDKASELATAIAKVVLSNLGP